MVPDSVKTLTPRERLILQLKYADDWTLADIARGIGVSRPAVARSHVTALTKVYRLQMRAIEQ